MIICVAQTKPILNDRTKNLEDHKVWIKSAAEEGADCIVFSELSMTGYEPKLADKEAVSGELLEIKELQSLSDQYNITICAGIPVRVFGGITISMVIFQPNKEQVIYSKQYLHEDEEPYFIEGTEQVGIEVSGIFLTPAICYESMKEKHLEACLSLGAKIYMASVAKHRDATERAYKYYPEVAKKYKIPIMMSNCVGRYDGMDCCGQSAVWDEEGKLILALNEVEIGLLMYDYNTKKASKKTI
ncbi:carbon-nitrogen hydrolase family protein [Reichenbachiella versicolor]|uniref:carbon-nitrogen hydrolase family protein n=1 Tax=Reichenbachiella versicolor TaxID=1821036 RepID=UPI000D6E7159|nr:carbon-nitrogen hydrolase family protein [Reichenbachiella versicolor]